MDYDAATNSSSNITTTSTSLPLRVFFYMFLLLDIPSVLCSLSLFYYYFSLPELRQHYAHQMIFYLLAIAFLVTAIDMPIILAYLQDNHNIASMKHPDLFCGFWRVYDYCTWSLNLWIMALFSLERYLVIFFKPIVMKNKKRRFFMYYVPVTVAILFAFFWYLYLLVLFPCTDPQFDFTQFLCSTPCYAIEASAILRNFDWIIGGLLPVFLTIFFTLVLILHVVYQRHKISRSLAQRETWKRTRKMFLQLLPITWIFLSFTLPLITVGLLAISDPWYSTIPYFYVSFLYYCLPLLVPFAVLSKQKVIQRRLLVLFRIRPLNRIAPMMATGLPMRINNSQETRKITENGGQIPRS